MTRLTLAQHRQHDTLINRILADATMKPEEKLLAVLMRRGVDYQEDLSGGRLATILYGIHAGADHRYAQPAALYLRLMREDIRRYDPTLAHLTRRRGCPVILPRAKRRCGKGGWMNFWITDVETGEKECVEYCSRHHEEGEAVVAANREALKGRIIPRPYANTGGRIAAHLPELAWTKYWHKLDPKWEPWPERATAAPVGPLRAVPDLDDDGPVPDTPKAPSKRRGLRVVPEES